ncbi:MAG: signal peptidase I [Planctomycetota bacterium]
MVELVTPGDVVDLGRGAVDRASGKKRAKSHRPVRDNVESFAIAILFAVLLKPFLLEAYQIPTPSMQPTMMGCPPAGVHDRLIVDKLRYALFEPKRWDIVVFRYPIRQVQSYVKRIVGVGGDRFIIGGGNLVPVDADGKEQAPIRKPANIQKGQWKELFPARMYLDDKSRLLDGYFSAQPQWTEEDGVLSTRAEPGRSVTVSYTDQGHGGLADRVYDGYPTSVAKAMRADARTMMASFEAVADARLAFTLQASGTVENLAVELDTRPPGKSNKALRFALEVGGGKARLVVREGGKEVKASEPVDFALGNGSRVGIRFTHVDGVLLAERDGTQIAELACHPYLVLDELPVGAATLAVNVRGGDQIRVSDLVVERDIQYKLGSLSKGVPIEVPEGHFFMMGDNPEQSADAREWRAITVGVEPDGTLVDPTTHPEARKMVGNLRPKGLSDEVDADENPVLVPERDAVVFTDDLGEVHVLHGQPNLSPSDKAYGVVSGVWFAGDKGPWQPRSHRVQFVPREHVLGRPLLNFWPIWPIGPMRFGFIR